MFLKLGRTNPPAYYKQAFHTKPHTESQGSPKPRLHPSESLRGHSRLGGDRCLVSGVAGRLLAALPPPSKPEGFPSVSAGCELLLARSREMTAELSQVVCAKSPPPSKVLMLRHREQRSTTRRSANTALRVQLW